MINTKTHDKKQKISHHHPIKVWKSWLLYLSTHVQKFCLYLAYLDHSTSSTSTPLLHCRTYALQSCTAHDVACIRWSFLNTGWCAHTSSQSSVIMRVRWGRAVAFDKGGTWCTWFQTLAKVSILDKSKRLVCPCWVHSLSSFGKVKLRRKNKK